MTLLTDPIDPDPLQITLERRITPDQTYQYLHLPFEVPGGIRRIHVRYAYDGAISSDPLLSGGNTIDIGIIDPRGAQFMTPGFRGWSGSARHEFEIGRDSATPGYIAGPIQAGTWHISLGVYKVADFGCLCKVEVTLTPSVDARPAAFPGLLSVRDKSPRLPNADGWYKGDIHCHSLHSDGDSTVPDIVRSAEALELDFLAITDHNNRSQWVELAGLSTRLTLIPGYEVTTYYGHWNIWGDGAWIDFRVQSPGDLRTAIQEARRQGYLISCNHPRPYGPDWAFPDVDGYQCVEVWNGPWEILNSFCLAFWDARLKQGQRLVAVGGSDFHFSKADHIAKLAHPTTFIYCPGEPSALNLLTALRAGHAFVSESPRGPRLGLRIGQAMMGDHRPASDGASAEVSVKGGLGAELQLCTGQGIVARYQIQEESQTISADIALASSLYVRAQLVDPTSGDFRAISNPIYLD